MARAGLQPRRQSSRLVRGTGAVLILAILYKIFFQSIAFPCLTSNSADREDEQDTKQEVDGFSWSCTRLEHPLMEGCEHLWLDEKNRRLYGTCSNFSRHEDTPDSANVTHRDHVSVMEIDSPPGQSNAYNLYQLEIAEDFDGELNLHGLDAHRIGDQLRFWLINHRPSTEIITEEDPEEDPEEKLNYTIEVFDLDEDTGTLLPVKTISSDALDSPNNLAVDPIGDEILVINDYLTKVGPFRGKLTGGEAYLSLCMTESGECRMVANKGFEFANGMVSDSHGRFYVSATTGSVVIYELEHGQLKTLDSFGQQMAIDRISVNAEDNLVITTFPGQFELQKASSDPHEPVVGASIFSTARQKPDTTEPDKQGYEAYLLIEDEDGELMPSTTIAVHDAKTDRLFLAGKFSRGISICTRQ
ncbi:hypothetical protein PENSTE_c004G02024 [Penicillium steckii]|uniref:SMP-30/Gluconolactonase/LRE-like region domain-containing protein n=1 Tax=Penicillium steckii TaxID=303698 RepID=A0A1V6TPQ2_9EURO|nr:hypothetical protein PENSTE_c004G02024 [Penicillium steckii]